MASTAADLRVDEPVIILTCARSGSTLLRFILDAHPALACPPETGVVDICSRMGVLSQLLSGPQADPGGPGELATGAIRIWVTTMFADYLRQAGKLRWCEKSLGSAEAAGPFLSLFPKARFICLYRSSMDVVDSLHEACPWGLHGYGLEPFTAAHPGDSVAAAADYWVCHTRPILEFEQAHPEASLRVRYEDLTADPAAEAGRIFEFLGEQAVPELLSGFLTARRSWFGPADHKIWETTRVHSDSVGRGARVPVDAIPPIITGMVNELHAELGYPPLHGHWSQAAAASVLTDSERPGQPAGGQAGHAAAAVQLEDLESRLAERLAVSAENLEPAAWAALGSTFRISAAVRLSSGALVGHWQVDLAAQSLTRADAVSDDEGRENAAEWGVVGPAGIWLAVLGGDVGLAAALRERQLRVTGPGGTEAPSAAGYMGGDPRVALLTRLIPSSVVTAAS